MRKKQLVHELPNIVINRFKNTVDQVHEMLFDAILSLKWKPGEPVREKEISQQLGVSRTPVREALLRLSYQGLVDIFPQRGTYVSKISIQNVREDHFIRCALESAVMREAIFNWNENYAEKIKDILHQQKLSADNDDYQNFYLLDQQFHQTLTECARSERVWQVINSSKTQLDRVRNLTYPLEGYLHEVVEQHLEIINSIQEKDEQNAVKAMQNHLQEVMKKIEILTKTHSDYFEIL